MENKMENNNTEPMIGYSIDVLLRISPEKILEDTSNTNGVFIVDFTDKTEKNKMFFDRFQSFEYKDNLDFSFFNEKLEGYRFHSKGIYRNYYVPEGGGLVMELPCSGMKHGFKIQKV